MDQGAQDFMKLDILDIGNPLGDFGTWDDYLRPLLAAKEHRWVCVMPV